MLDVAEKKQGEMMVLTPRGRLDSGTSPDFEAMLLTRIAKGDDRLILDLTELEYISSAGLRVLLMAAKRVKAVEGRIVLCALRENIREVFEISGFLSLFEVHDKVGDALE